MVLSSPDSRVIGVYEGTHRGPLILALGAVHGNEPAGVQALVTVFHLLEQEPAIRPDFEFSGRLVGLVGNLRAYRERQRFIDSDLNRLWSQERVERLFQEGALHTDIWEERELLELLSAMQKEVNDYQPEELIILDLHTTSAGGGIFSIPLEDDPKSVHLAAELHAPVILGLLKGLEGTLMHYAAHAGQLYMLPGRIRCVAFESGQHDDPQSVSRSISAIVNTLRSAGCIRIDDVDHEHEKILLRYTAGLPRINQIVHVYHIAAGEQFVMQPGYVNFQTIARGEHLADNQYGPIYAPFSGRILMPLYQPKGADGFFIVVEQ